MPIPGVGRWLPAFDPTGCETALLELAMRMDNDQTFLVRACAFASRVVIRLFMNIRFEGLDRVPSSGAVILAGNHTSNADPFPIGEIGRAHV